MPRRTLRTGVLLAVLVALVALGAGSARGWGTVRLSTTGVTGVASPATSGGAPDAVLRTEADRLETALSTRSSSDSRLLLVLAVALVGAGLVSLATARRRSTLLRGGAPLSARLRAWIGLRAPPSLLLLSRPY